MCLEPTFCTGSSSSTAQPWTLAPTTTPRIKPSSLRDCRECCYSLRSVNTGNRVRWRSYNSRCVAADDSTQHTLATLESTPAPRTWTHKKVKVEGESCCCCTPHNCSYCCPAAGRFLSALELITKVFKFVKPRRRPLL